MSKQVDAVMGHAPGKSDRDWSVQDAWAACYTNGAEFPPAVKPLDSEGITEIDRVVASFFGPVTQESLEKAHAAVTAIYPYLAVYPVPVARLSGEALSKHIYENVREAMLEYAPMVDVSKRSLSRDIRALKEGRITDIYDWFFIWDAMGSLGYSVQDDELKGFYDLAGWLWHYQASVHSEG